MSIPIIDISNSIRKTECMFEIRKFLSELKIGDNEYESYDAFISVNISNENDKKEFLEQMEKELSKHEPKMQH